MRLGRMSDNGGPAVWQRISGLGFLIGIRRRGFRGGGGEMWPLGADTALAAITGGVGGLSGRALPLVGSGALLRAG